MVWIDTSITDVVESTLGYVKVHVYVHIMNAWIKDTRSINVWYDYGCL